MKDIGKNPRNELKISNPDSLRVKNGNLGIWNFTGSASRLASNIKKNEITLLLGYDFYDVSNERSDKEFSQNQEWNLFSFNKILKALNLIKKYLSKI